MSGGNTIHGSASSRGMSKENIQCVDDRDVN